MKRRLVAYCLILLGCGNPSSDTATDAAIDARIIPQPSAEPPDPVSLPCGGLLGFSTAIETLGTTAENRAAHWTDLDGDGWLDLVGIGVNAGSSGAIVSVRLGIGGGAFSSETATYHAEVQPSRTHTQIEENLECFIPTTLTDVDNDSRQDLVMMGGWRDGPMQTMMHKSDGTLEGAAPSSRGGGTTIVVGDFDGDGIRDLVLPDPYPFLGGGDQDPEVRLLRGDGHGRFSPDRTIWMGHGPIAAAALDLNSDGILDVVVDNNGPRNILIGRGDATFEPPVTSTPDLFTGNVVIAHDLNGDQRPDLLSMLPSGAAVYLNHGDGTLSAGIARPGLWGIPVFADFNGDGHVDIATDEANIKVFLGHGDGSFDSALEYSGGTNFYRLSAGDVDRDGRVDLLVEGGTNEVFVLRGLCL